MINELDKNQIGFVQRMSTHVNIDLLIKEIVKTKRSKGYCIIFIDFKSA